MLPMYIHLSLSLLCPNYFLCGIKVISLAVQLLATGSWDKSVKLWDLSNNQPSWVATHKPNAVRAMT